MQKLRARGRGRVTKTSEGVEQDSEEQETHPLDTSQIRIVRSRLALTMKSSLGRKRADEIEWSWPCSVRTFFHSLFVSHSLIVRSDEHETARAASQSRSLSRTAS